jgi:hypothetical protein
MLNETQRSEIATLVRTMQIIVGALILGVANFAAIVVFMSRPGQAPPANDRLLTYLSAGCAVVSVLASFIVPRLMAGPVRKSMASAEKPDNASVRPLAQVFQTLLIVRCAILEGAAFFCLVAFMLEHDMIALAAAGLVTLLLAAQFPTASRLEAWIENELFAAG